MASRLISDLDPKAQGPAQAALDECRVDGIDALVTCTYRAPAEQTLLYAQGRTAPGPVVTNAKANQSMHQFRCALDLVPVVNGKCVWDGSDPIWGRMLAIFKKHGFELGAEWRSFPEKPHVQITGGHPLAYFQAGGKI